MLGWILESSSTQGSLQVRDLPLELGIVVFLGIKANFLGLLNFIYHIAIFIFGLSQLVKLLLDFALVRIGNARLNTKALHAGFGSAELVLVSVASVWYI